MTQYRIEFKERKSTLHVTYQKGQMHGLELHNEGDLNDDQVYYLMGELPYNIVQEDMAKSFCQTSNGKLKMEAVPTDLSFDNFWNTYGNKIGKKERTAELWKHFSNADKAAALIGIKKYKKWLGQNTSVQMLYPETFLSQRRFENEF
jgi:hypothetical protein